MTFIRERYKGFETMDIVELYGYINEIEMGYISANYHGEDNNLVILNYTELATFEKRWNKYTMSARGLILDLTDVKDNGIIYILARPFQKFPNYGTNEIEGYENDIDWNEIESIMEKMDGSLGISYPFHGEIRWATRGSFHSDQAKMATKMWKEKYGEANYKYRKLFQDKNATLLAEIIYPENRVVVDYKDRKELVLLGVMGDKGDAPYHAVSQLGRYLHIPVAPQYEYTLEEMLQKRKEISANEEGWIVRFKNGKRLKIKGEEYLQVHRIIHGLSDKAKVQAWAEGRMNEYIKMLPEEFRQELEEFADELDRLKDSLYTILQATFEFIAEEAKDQKSFALKVQEIIAKEFQGFMFEARKKGSISVDSIRQYIYRNYREYLEVIRWKNNDL
jgi:RNA ligase